MRERLLVIGILALGALAAMAGRADALTYSVSNGPYDMRQFVSIPGTEFGCSTGYVYEGGYWVTAPSNYNVRVYATYTVYRLENGIWVTYRGWSGSTVPSGLSVRAGSSQLVPRLALPTAPGYYRAQIEVDFHVDDASQTRLGRVVIYPNLTSDWSAQYAYVSAPYSFCWHG